MTDIAVVYIVGVFLTFMISVITLNEAPVDTDISLPEIAAIVILWPIVLLGAVARGITQLLKR